MLFTFIGCDTEKQEQSTASSPDTEANELYEIFSKYEPTLDGAYAEGYASELYEAYTKSTDDLFVDMLSECEINSIKGIIDLFVSEIYIEGEDGLKKVEEILNKFNENPELSNKQKYIFYKMYASALFFEETLHIDG